MIGMRVAFILATLLDTTQALTVSPGSSRESTTISISRRALILFPVVAAGPAIAEDDWRVTKVLTAAERLAASGALDAKNAQDPRCASGVYLNFKPGTCSPVSSRAPWARSAVANSA